MTDKNTETEGEKIKREVKQVGLDVFIFALIVALIGGMCLGLFIAP